MLSSGGTGSRPLLPRCLAGFHQMVQRPSNGQPPPRSQKVDYSAGPPPFFGSSMVASFVACRCAYLRHRRPGPDHRRGRLRPPRRGDHRPRHHRRPLLGVAGGGPAGRLRQYRDRRGHLDTGRHGGARHVRARHGGRFPRRDRAPRPPRRLRHRRRGAGRVGIGGAAPGPRRLGRHGRRRRGGHQRDAGPARRAGRGHPRHHQGGPVQPGIHQGRDERLCGKHRALPPGPAPLGLPGRARKPGGQTRPAARCRCAGPAARGGRWGHRRAVRCSWPA